MTRLFLTGPMGCGKSTAIAKALGDHLPKAGGFLTVRHRDEAGQVVHFSLQRPDSSEAEIFIDCSQEPCRIYPEVFERFGTALLEDSHRYPFVVLDEIGGLELLSPAFTAALERLLESGIPCIGVMKGEGPSGKMIQRLGLDDEYESAAAKLRNWMRQDRDTVLYECSQFDPEGLRLAQQWVSELVAE